MDKKRGLWWWVDRYRNSTAFIEMTLTEQGAYRNLLDFQRLVAGGLIPNDERTLAKACGDPLEWPNVRDKVLRWFRPTPDGKHLFNPTAMEINAESDRISAANAVGGKARAEKATRRDSGRFTSDTSGATSGKTSGATSDPPASVSVAVSVVRSPLPLSVTENNGNNRPGADAPAAAAGAEPPDEPRERPPAATKRTWLTKPGELWQARWGAESEPPWGEMSSAFSKPYKAFEGRGEVDELWTRWERFLAAAERAEWARPTRFIQGLGQWAADARPQTRVGPAARTSVGEQQMQEARKFLESKGKSR